MKVKKSFATVLAAATTLSAVSVLSCSSVIQASATDNPVKIMALGDSITDGYWTSGGYRKYLYHELEQMGYNNIDRSKGK